MSRQISPIVCNASSRLDFSDSRRFSFGRFGLRDRAAPARGFDAPTAHGRPKFLRCSKSPYCQNQNVMKDSTMTT
jgi:hypothetical protein